MLSLICVFAIFALDSIFLSYLSKRKYGEVFPFSIFLQTLVFYIFGLLFNLYSAFYLSLILPFCGIILSILLVFKDKSFFKEYIFTLGLGISMFFFAFVVFYHWGRNFSFVDEFAHWGLMVKESFRLKEFYYVKESVMYYNKDYPPFFTLIELYWCLVNNAFEERFCYMAINFSELSMLLPLFEKYFKVKNFYKTSIFITLSILLGYIIGYTYSLSYNTFFYNCIYIDWPLAFLIGFLFIYIFNCRNEKKDYMFICIGLSALVITKQISIAFYLLIVVYFLSNKIIKKELNINNIVYFLLMILIPIAILYTWNYKVEINEIESKFNVSEIDFLFPVKYFKGLLDSQQTTTIRNFLYALLHNGIISWPLEINYVILVLLITVGLVLSGIRKNLKRSSCVSLAYLLGGIGYAYAMLLSYVYLFGPVEGPTVTMFDRYMLIYVLSGIFMLFNVYAQKELDTKDIIIFVCIECVFIKPSTIVNSKPQLSYKTLYQDMNVSLEYYDSIVTDDEKVLVIAQTNAEKQAAMKYIVSYSLDKYDFIDVTYAGDYDFDHGKALWEDDFRELLSSYNYIYLLVTDDTFINNFWYTDEEPVTDRMYEIIYGWKYEIYINPIYIK